MEKVTHSLEGALHYYRTRLLLHKQNNYKMHCHCYH